VFNRLLTTRGRYWTFILGLVMAYFYAFQVWADILADAVGVELWDEMDPRSET
jgi:hypothetical protein